MKQDYFLRISDKATNQILFRKWFENVDFREAILQATKYITENTVLKTNLSSNIDIRLLSIENGKVVNRIMDWNDRALTDGTGHFADWVYCQNKDEKKGVEKLELRNFRLTRFGVGVFTAIFIGSFILSMALLNLPDSNILNESKTSLGFFNVLLSIIFTGISPAFRESFNKNAENKKDVLKHNIKLEFPSWLAALSTIVYFFEEDISGILTLVQLAIIAIAAVGFGMKIMFEYESDINKFYSREFEILFKI